MELEVFSFESWVLEAGSGEAGFAHKWGGGRGCFSRTIPWLSSGINAGEEPGRGGLKGELEEEGVVEFDVPLDLLPSVVPPRAGEGERAAGFSDGTLVGAGEEGEGAVVGAVFV